MGQGSSVTTKVTSESRHPPTAAAVSRKARISACAVGSLAANGFPAVGYDPSEGLLAQARAMHPALKFERAVLPELHGIAQEKSTTTDGLPK